MFTKVQLLQRCEITMAFYMFLGLTKAARLRMRVTGGHYPAPRLDSMDIDGLGDSFDIRDTDSEDEGIKEGRKKKRQVVTILSFVCTILLQD